MATTWDKAQFYASYRIAPVCLETNRRYSETPLHYHEAVIKPILRGIYQRLIQALEITADDHILIVGCGFGWGAEILQELTGCAVVGSDISEYIQANKNKSGDDELQEAIEIAGLNKSDGLGLEIWQKFSNPNPRATIEIHNENLLTEASRSKIPSGITRIITEDFWSTLDQADRDALQVALDAFGVPVNHIIRGAIV